MNTLESGLYVRPTKRLQYPLSVITTSATKRRDHDERQASRSQPTERPQEHRPQDAGGEGRRTPQRLKARSALTRGALPGEDEATFNELSERLMAELQPVGILETLLVEEIIGAYWRLHRLRRVETGMFAWQLYEELRERAQSEAQTYKRNILDDIASRDTMITDKQKHEEALSKAQEMKAKQDTETATLGRTFIRDANKANAFSKLSRYEVTIVRSFYRALHELQRLQAARLAEGSVTPPVALDVDVSEVSTEDL